MKNLDLPKIWPVACHTDQVGPGSTFVAVKGHATDGLQFVALALQKGATKIVVDQLAVTDEMTCLAKSYAAQLVGVENPRAALSTLSAQAWGYPARKLKIIGITGTKGKTTSVYALRHVLATAGKSVAMLTGVENMIGAQKFTANLTTPHPDYLQMFLAQCVQVGIEYVVMEVSAQALSLNRVDDVLFTGVIFTNQELEHSEFYASMEQYFAAKCAIFNLLHSAAVVVLNLDDAWVSKILQNNLILSQHQIVTFGRTGVADYRLALAEQNLLAGLEFTLQSQNGAETFSYKSAQLYGIFNAYNLAGVVLCAKQLGIAHDKIVAAVSSFISAPGRLEIYKLPNGAQGVVDYAHTPSSFDNVLSLLRQQTKHLIVIFGAGGGRDPIKRPIMGEIATKLCDVVILTNDNPRNEDAQTIIQHIMGSQHPQKFLVELDRAKAIALAYQLSKSGSIIVLLGKGPDEYQIIGNQKYFFSDRQQLLSCI